MNKIILLILVVVLGSGCAQNMTRKYVVDDGPRIIEVPEGVRDAGPEKEDQIGFEDVSLPDKVQGHKPRTVTNAAVVDARTDDYVKNGTADVIVQPDNTRLYPYGLAQARLTCAKMLFCVIELEKGEQVLDMASGDTVRWTTKVAYKGDASSFSAMVMVKPLIGNLTTNLSIMTDRRDYNILMTSIDSGEYMPRIGFYYPQEAADRAVIPSPPALRPDMTGLSNLDIENLHFNYVLGGDRSLSWCPVSVFDDGNKVFIKMGEKATRSQLPVFHVINRSGQSEVVNYRYRKPYFIIDTMFDRGELVLGSGSYQARIDIRRKGP